MNKATILSYLHENPSKYLILYMDNDNEISVEAVEEDSNAGVLHVTEPSEYVVDITKISYFELLQRSTY
ncbi:MULTISPECIES: hypothetical protein [Staphylococcus]|uniref:hypothetical protein n=1 Tax=Staphylococcus TaxID=1279 RepID=UPI000D03C494|nr:MULTISPECIES: hypothetical protein [Staphylococcus]MCD8914411.1 hypothetical protein [Staphylococcus simulans]UXV34351.1 hypothetical protein MUA90_09985 [Staphylococcus sp. IVB6181]